MSPGPAAPSSGRTRLGGPRPHERRGRSSARAAGLALGLDTLIWGAPFRLEIPQLLAMAGGVSLHLDRLGAFFLVVVEVVAIPSALFGGAYSRVYEGTHSLRLLGAMLNLFLLAVSLVPFADNVVTFLLLWEADVGRLLLPGPDRVRSAGDPPGRPLVSGHGARGAGAADGGLPARGGERAVHRIRGPPRRRGGAAAPARNAVFLLALLGFGSKAGLVPLHVWLPLAHPAAPSHVSALMSGAMIKMGVYGLLRVALDLLGGRPALVGRRRPGGGGRLRAPGRALRADGAGPQAAPGLLLRRERRDHLPRHRRGHDVPELRADDPRAAGARGRPLPHPQPRLLQGTALSRRRARCCTRRTRATWRSWAGSSRACPARPCASSWARPPSPGCRR